MKKQVRFSNVEIREYALVVGDHPFCSDGLALSLDWRHSPYTTVRNVLEENKPSVRPKRLCYMDRKLRLQHVSNEMDEIRKYLEIERLRCEMQPLYH